MKNNQNIENGIFDSLIEDRKEDKKKIYSKKEKEDENEIIVKNFITRAENELNYKKLTESEIEKQYWMHMYNEESDKNESTKKNMAYYYADINAQLTDGDFDSLNIEKLGGLLDELLGPEKIPGITNPYTYIGSRHSTFSWVITLIYNISNFIRF